MMTNDNKLLYRSNKEFILQELNISKQFLPYK
jgi:hypothetical protein